MAKYTVIIEKDCDGWLVSSVVELPGCHTQGKTIEELRERTKEAIQAYVGSEDPEDNRVEFIGIEKIEV